MNFLLLYALMRRHIGGLDSKRMAIMLGKVAVAAAALIAVCAASSHWLLDDWQTQSLPSKGSWLLATVGVGAAVFVGVGTALRIEELGELTGVLRRRFGRRGESR